MREKLIQFFVEVIRRSAQATKARGKKTMSVKDVELAEESLKMKN